MSESPDPLPRLSALEGRVDRLEENVATARLDAAAARHLAAAFDRDLADLTVKVDANRKAINALGVQTAERFDRLDHRFTGLEGEMRSGFATSAAGQQVIVDLLTRLLPDES